MSDHRLLLLFIWLKGLWFRGVDSSTEGGEGKEALEDTVDVAGVAQVAETDGCVVVGFLEESGVDAQGGKCICLLGPEACFSVAFRWGD